MSDDGIWSKLIGGRPTNILVKAALAHISDLCAGRKTWRMCVPPEWDDSDALLAGTITRLNNERDNQFWFQCYDEVAKAVAPNSQSTAEVVEVYTTMAAERIDALEQAAKARDRIAELEKALAGALKCYEAHHYLTEPVLTAEFMDEYDSMMVPLWQEAKRVLDKKEK